MMDIDAITTELERKWGSSPFGPTCLRLAEAVLHLDEAEAQMLTYQGVLELLNEQELTQEVHAALAVLTSSENAILKAGGIYIDDDDKSSELTDEEFQRVVTSNVLIDPATGENVQNPRERVMPFFALRGDEEQ